MSERCDNCRYFEKTEDVHLLGRCLRHAPQPVQKPASTHWRWPLVLIDDWCGEWRQ